MSDTSTAGARARLLDVAGRLFYAEGIHAVGVDRVVAVAEVAKATLYAHFDGKEALVAAYLSERSDEWQACIDAALADAAGNPRLQMRRLFRFLGERVRAPDYRGCPFINAAAEYPGPGRVAEEIRRHRQRVRAVFAGIVREEGLEPGERVTEALIVLWDGAMVSAQLDVRPEAAEDALRAAERILADRSGAALS